MARTQARPAPPGHGATTAPSGAPSAIPANPVAGDTPAQPAAARAVKAPAGSSVPSARMAPKPAPSNQVSGFQMEEVARMTPVQKTIGALVLLALAAGVIGGGTFGGDGGWGRSSRLIAGGCPAA